MSDLPPWVRPPADADPKLQAGITSAAFGAAAITGGLLLLSDGLTRQPNCTNQFCDSDNGTFETTMGVSMLTAGLTQAAFSTALLTAHMRQGPARQHRSTPMAAAGASLTSLATGALIGGASGWLQSAFEEAGDELIPPMFMVASGALLLPIGLPMWFAGSGAPQELHEVIDDENDARRESGRKPLDTGPTVMRNPAMAALGGGLTGLGGLGVITTLGTTIAVINRDAALDDDGGFFHLTVMGTASLGLLSVGLPMLVLGLEEVPAVLAHADNGVMPQWAPQVSLGIGSTSLSWQLQ